MTTPVTTAQHTHTQWLGPIPAAWDVIPLKFVATVFPSNVDKHSREDETPVELCNYTDVYYNDIISADIDFMKATATSEQIGKFQLRSGDTIITKDSESADDIGISAYVPEDLDGVVCGYHLSIIRPGRRVSGRFIKRLFDSHYVKAILETSANGLTRVGLGQYALDNIDIPVPPLTSQNAIAAFLDHETAKIDALIDKQEQLIATLREDRAATITQAVTKGLDPDTNFSPSGIDWISEIPDHWSHSRIGYACNLLTGFPFRSEGFTDDSDELPLLRGLNVGVQSIDWSSVVYWPRSESAELHPYRLQIGDIVVGLDRPFIGAGTRVAQIGAQDVPSLLLQRVLRLRATDEFENRYVAYLLSGQGFVDHLTPMFTGVSVPHISPGQVASFAIPKPPVHEQRKIIDFLDVRCAKIDALIGKSTDMIETLREYRSALITNAVTGKIDVREAV